MSSMRFGLIGGYLFKINGDHPPARFSQDDDLRRSEMLDPYFQIPLTETITAKGLMEETLHHLGCKEPCT